MITVMEWHLIGALGVVIILWLRACWKLSDERFKRQREDWERARLADGWTRVTHGRMAGFLIPPAPPMPRRPPPPKKGVTP